MSDPALVVVDAPPVTDRPDAPRSDTPRRRRGQWWRYLVFIVFSCGYITLWGWGWAWLWVWIFDPACK